jgi:hypothetical protein
MNDISNEVNNIEVEALTADNVSVDKASTELIQVNDSELEKSKGGRPPHLATPDTRNRVYILSTVGTRHEDIASVLNISHDTLVKYYKEELDKGRIEANASVAETLFKQAKEGNTTAMIFWLKSRAKWTESTKHEISGSPDGVPVEVKIVTGID